MHEKGRIFRHEYFHVNCIVKISSRETMKHQGLGFTPGSVGGLGSSSPVSPFYMAAKQKAEKNVCIQTAQCCNFRNAVKVQYSLLKNEYDSISCVNGVAVCDLLRIVISWKRTRTRPCIIPWL